MRWYLYVSDVIWKEILLWTFHVKTADAVLSCAPENFFKNTKLINAP